MFSKTLNFTKKVYKEEYFKKKINSSPIPMIAPSTVEKNF